MMTTRRSPLGSPGRWTGSAAGTPHGRCRPRARSPRPANGWEVTCFPSCSNGPAGRSPGRSGRRRTWPWAPPAERSCGAGGWSRSTGSRSICPTAPTTRPSSGTPGPGTTGQAFPKARVVALAECGTHAFLAAEIGAYKVGERTLAARLYPRLRADQLLVADRGFYSSVHDGHALRQTRSAARG